MNKQQKTAKKRLKRKKIVAIKNKKREFFKTEIDRRKKILVDKMVAQRKVDLNKKLKESLGIPESEDVATNKLVKAMNLRLKSLKAENPPPKE